jgi:hypothetical protein
VLQPGLFGERQNSLHHVNRKLEHIGFIYLLSPTTASRFPTVRQSLLLFAEIQAVFDTG